MSRSCLRFEARRRHVGSSTRVLPSALLLLSASCSCVLVLFSMVALSSAVAAAASTSTAAANIDTATLRSMGLSRKEIKEIAKEETIMEQDDDEAAFVEEEVNEEEEAWKSNAEWWKDPLAMFSDDEDEQVPVAEKEEEIDETISIIEEAESLGDDIAEEEAEVVDTSETVAVENEIEEPPVPTIDDVLAEAIIEPETTPDEPPVSLVEEPGPEEEQISRPEPETKDSIPEKVVLSKPELHQEEKTVTKKSQIPVKQKANKIKTRQAAVNAKPKQSLPTDDGMRASSASPMALIVPLVPKLQSALTGVPVVQLAASAVLAKFCFDSVKSKRSNSKRGTQHHDHDMQGAHEHGDNYESSDAEDLFEDQFDLGNYSDEDEEEYNDPMEETTEPRKHKPSTKKEVNASPPNARRSGGGGRLLWMQGVKDRLARTPDGERIPPARDLYRQVEDLRTSLSMVESERDAMEKEYETANYQLQESQTELSTLKSSARYLKAQLRDNEDVMNKAIRVEQRKAWEELSRMKAAMVGILEKERRAMREELKRQTKELRSLLAEVSEGDQAMEEDDQH